MGLCKTKRTAVCVFFQGNNHFKTLSNNSACNITCVDVFSLLFLSPKAPAMAECL